MWFNRKSTRNQQAIEKLNKRLDAALETIRKQKTDNESDILEFANMYSKTRRLYLRLVRIAKVDSELTPEDEPTDQNVHPSQMSNLEIREEIERKYLGG